MNSLRFGILFTDAVLDHRNELNFVDETSNLSKFFGGLYPSIVTLFRSISNGLTWGEAADALENMDNGIFWSSLFHFYVAFCTIPAVSGGSCCRLKNSGEIYCKILEDIARYCNTFRFLRYFGRPVLNVITHTVAHSHKQTYLHACIQTHRRTDGWTDGQTDIHRHTHMYIRVYIYYYTYALAYMFVHVCVCANACICILYIYICICFKTYVYLYIWLHMNVYACICMHMNVNVCIWMQMYVYVCTCV